MFNYIIKTWKDITQDNSGHTIAKDLFKALSFLTGLPICVGAAIASGYGIKVDTEPAIILLAAGLGLQTGKAVEGYFQRKTNDNNGNPLATPASVPEGPVEVMPQVP